MGSALVVTRPRNQSSALAEMLERRGYRTLVEPMLDIVDLRPPLPPLTGFGGLVFSSANAVSAFAARAADRSHRTYAVGASTARALSDAGFSEIISADGDARDLAAAIARSYRSSLPLLHVSGRAVAGDLGEMLRPAGIGVERLVVYDAVAKSALSPSLVRAIETCSIAGVLLFSARTAETFGTLVASTGLQNQFGIVSAYCLSAAVARAAALLRWKEIAVAARPTRDSLLDLIPPPALDGRHG